MAEIIRMPKMSDTMTEGVIVAWHKKVGDVVKPGDILADVETDKAVMELENYVKGLLLHIGIEKGKTVPVDAIIAIVGQEGEDISPLLNENPKTGKNPENVVVTEQKLTPNSLSATRQENERVIASPLAKTMALNKGIDIRMVSGSGDGGRVIKRDIENYKAQNSPSKQDQPENSYHDAELSQMRKTIARRLAESKFSAPHFYLTMDMDMDQMVLARNNLNKGGNIKLSFNDIIIKAVSIAIKKNPLVNASWLGDKIRYHHSIHIGVAMAVEEGLVVPVLKNADTKTLTEISTDIKSLGELAKTKKLKPEDFTGNTFTVSNLGMFGIEEFTAIINPPDSCILAVGAVRETAVVKAGQITSGYRMKVTLSCDHRSVDGAIGAAFLSTLRNLLEEPVKMLL